MQFYLEVSYLGSGFALNLVAGIYFGFSHSPFAIYTTAEELAVFLSLCPQSLVKLRKNHTLEPLKRARYDSIPGAAATATVPLGRRYRLFAYRHGRLISGRVHHAPYRVGETTVRKSFLGGR